MPLKNIYDYDITIAKGTLPALVCEEHAHKRKKICWLPLGEDHSTLSESAKKAIEQKIVETRRDIRKARKLLKSHISTRFTEVVANASVLDGIKKSISKLSVSRNAVNACVSKIIEVVKRNVKNHSDDRVLEKVEAVLQKVDGKFRSRFENELLAILDGPRVAKDESIYLGAYESVPDIERHCLEQIAFKHFDPIYPRLKNFYTEEKYERLKKECSDLSFRTIEFAISVEDGKKISTQLHTAAFHNAKGFIPHFSGYITPFKRPKLQKLKNVHSKSLRKLLKIHQKACCPGKTIEQSLKSISKGFKGGTCVGQSSAAVITTAARVKCPTDLWNKMCRDVTLEGQILEHLRYDFYCLQRDFYALSGEAEKRAFLANRQIAFPKRENEGQLGDPLLTAEYISENLLRKKSNHKIVKACKKINELLIRKNDLLNKRYEDLTAALRYIKNNSLEYSITQRNFSKIEKVIDSGLEEKVRKIRGSITKVKRKIGLKLSIDDLYWLVYDRTGDLFRGYGFTFDKVLVLDVPAGLSAIAVGNLFQVYIEKRPELEAVTLSMENYDAGFGHEVAVLTKQKMFYDPGYGFFIYDDVKTLLSDVTRWMQKVVESGKTCFKCFEVMERDV